MGFHFSGIDNITELKSEIQYIKRFIGRITGIETHPTPPAERNTEFYVYFSLEYQPLGRPLVNIKYIDPPTDTIKSSEPAIIARILDMEKTKELKHTPFNGL
ncbi:MAG: hypothetical protein JXB03_07915 [Spirochaetales bacterium]|nr:hypothetical protein [Spirochaetales bacterium]